ncbi:hypothetical protein [Clostridium algidicarnis]|uniref:hypothetical protein n=1 Tax=Clostridium algidicarnis TaxID=37659 RepID=UPI001C0CC6E3|nr:hypothetical protein [Clostridium algidicarnis]MBU3205201.1 hypothetical protein [Clostridium algidicarnis]MBU3213354.1 hypothetical protein [Clostridium algidicarnis]MBU3223297.1 hypothetical protein [Clostridium algidicarnis]
MSFKNHLKTRKRLGQAQGYNDFKEQDYVDIDIDMDNYYVDNEPDWLGGAETEEEFWEH